MSKLWWLASNELLAGLTRQEISYLFHLMSPSLYEQDKVIFSSDLPGDVLYFIQRGAVRVMQKTAIGTHKQLMVLGSGYIFGILSLIDLGKKNAFVTTCTQSQMLVLRKQAFEKLIKYHPEMGARLVNLLKEYVQQEYALALAREHKYGHRRIGRLLSHYVDNEEFSLRDRPCDFHYNPQEIAQLTATSPETVERVLQRLMKRGILALHHQNLKLCDKIALQEQF